MEGANVNVYKVGMVREALLACRLRRGSGEGCLLVKLSDKSIFIHNQITKDGIEHQYDMSPEGY